MKKDVGMTSKKRILEQGRDEWNENTIRVSSTSELEDCRNKTIPISTAADTILCIAQAITAVAGCNMKVNICHIVKRHYLMNCSRKCI